MRLAIACLIVCWFAPFLAVAQERMPKSVDPRLKIELFAEQPQIVTPTGLDVDSKGRVWAIESNTHFPPQEYAGHKSDRLLVMRDTNGDGRADEITTFADGFTHAMSVAVRPTGEVFLATRREIVQLIDKDGDLKVDERRRIVHLETPGNYPHNGLAGFAWDAQGWMYFGFGENLGADYKIIGSDGGTLTGGGEGGNLYRCRPDGTQLTQWATGFWNPHASCIDSQGRMFTVDNDPDSRPPCRLLHIIEGGDYGYRFRNGRKGLHPFTSWNGEIPGTLPMVAGTGEAPSGIVSYESTGLPDEYLGNLLVTSWGDHRIDRFRLKPKGASYESLAEPLITGGETFRPVGLSIAPDGSLYCTDWVLKDYKLHGKGRIWRISSSVRSSSREAIQPGGAKHEKQCRQILADLQAPRDPKRPRAPDMDLILAGLLVDDPFLFSAAVRQCSQLHIQWDDKKLQSRLQWKYVIDLKKPQKPRAPRSQLNFDLSELTSVSPALVETRHRLAWLLAARLSKPQDSTLAKVCLDWPDLVVRRLAVQWVAEERLTELRPRVEALLNEEPLNSDLFLAILAGLELLDGADPANFDKTPAAKYVLPILLDDGRPVAVRTEALRLVSPTDPALKVELLRKLLSADDATLKLEAVRTLQASTLPEAAELLRQIAADKAASVPSRAEAIVGLASTVVKKQPEDPTLPLLVRLLHSTEPALVIESLRAARGQRFYDESLNQALTSLAQSIQSPSREQRELAEELSRLLPESGQPDSVRQAKAARPQTIAQWLARAAETGDAEAGRRVFFHPLGAGCWKCHTVNGRGGAVGPDLSMIARTMDRQKLAQSILEPAKEIAPQFTAWNFVMTTGQVHQGMILGDTRDDKQRIGLSDGRQMDLRVADIEQREPSSVSIMPANLIEQLTLSEFRHLLAFLETLK